MSSGNSCVFHLFVPSGVHCDLNYSEYITEAYQVLGVLCIPPAQAKTFSNNEYKYTPDGYAR